MTQATIIPNLTNPAPSRADPLNFDSRGASFLTDLPTLVDKVNTVVSELNAWNASTASDKTSTDASKTASIASEQAAKTSALSSAQRSAVWTSGVNYSLGYLVESPITARQYRCIQAGVSTTDPSLDTTRWKVLGFEFNTQLPNIKPTLNLNFAKTKILDPRITFTRNSIGTYFDQYGVMKTATANQARFDHDPVTGESLGLLIEEQRTNLLTYSEQFDNAAWTKSNATVTPNTIVGPDGTLTGDRLVGDSGATGNKQASQIISLTTGTLYTLSVYAKASGVVGLLLGFGSISPWSTIGGHREAAFNILTGVVIRSDGSVTASITSVGNGWYRCVVQAPVTTTTTNAFPSVRLVDATGSVSFAGDGTSGIYIWGAQLEEGAFPTSYIPTIAAQVTRAADAAVMTGTNFSSWYRQDEGTLYEEGSTLKRNTDSDTRFTSSITDGLSNFIMGLRYTIAVNPRVDYAGVTQASLVTLNPYQNDAFHKNAIAVKQNDFAASTNGLAALSDSFVSIPMTMNTFSIGAYGTVYLCGHIKKIAYYPKRLSNIELQALTA